jgi:hypothetical protein
MQTRTPTHEVTNQSVPFEDVNLFELDLPLREALEREGAGWAVDRARDTGAVAGSAEALSHGRRAERNEPGCARTTGSGTGSTRSSSTRAGTGCCAARSSARSTRCRGATRGPARTSRARRSSCCGRTPTPA